MKPKTKKIILWSSVGIILTVAGIYIYKQFKLLGDSCYAFSGAIIKKLSLSNVDMTLLFSIQNKSDITITIINQYYEIYMNGILVSKIKKNEPFKLESKTTKVLPLDISFLPQDLLKAGLEAIRSIIADTSKIIITVKGNISVKSGFITFRKLNLEARMSLKEMIDIYKAPPSESCKGFK